LRAWDFEMRADRAAPALFALFERRLYEAIFEDDFGEALCKDWRSKANVWRIMTRSVVAGGLEAWFDRAETAAREGRNEILRRAFGEAVRELSRRFGDDPRGYRWGALHSLAFRHALSRGSRLFGLYFDRGPFPASGEAGTLNKMESAFDRFEVTIGPSLRQIVDLGDADGFQLALPGGQSGNPASSHYDDLLALWREGRYHTLPTSREAIDQVASARLALLP
jgi:penicillin amidase